MIKYCICLHTLIPVRIHPSERAEMVTQILFGEIYTVIELSGNWTKIVTDFDDYEGWIDKKLNYEISENIFKQIQLSKVVSSFKTSSTIFNKTDNKHIPLAAGSSLPFKDELCEFLIVDKKFKYLPKIENVLSTGSTIVELAKQFENAPYLWGGRTIFGVDCSGLTQLVYKMVGICLPRDASVQIGQGELIGFISDAQPGDLAFFDNDEGVIIHVGILIDSETIIHASGWVRIDKIDHQGIFNTDTMTYSHKLRVIKRIIN